MLKTAYLQVKYSFIIQVKYADVVSYLQKIDPQLRNALTRGLFVPAEFLLLEDSLQRAECSDPPSGHH